MSQPLGRVLIDRERIAERTRDLGARITADLLEDLQEEGLGADASQRIVLMPVLTGAMVFAADLIRSMPLAMQVRAISVSSYPGKSTTSQGVTLRGDFPDDLGGTHVVLVDDIFDTGRTLSVLQRMAREQSPASLRTCVLLSKNVERLAKASVDYVGFEIPPEFVIGYGLDFDGMHRNLPDIRVMDPEADPVGPKIDPDAR
jgi:hypoxanthine phosphoribosyltransferase